MIDKETLKKLCEYPYAPSLIGEAIVDWHEATAEQRAHWAWGMSERLKGEEPKQ
jgi:hypothetical protein